MPALSFLFIAVFLGANAYFAYRVSILMRLITATHGPVWSGTRIDRIPDRIMTVLMNVLGQRAVLKKKNAGIMHATIFWGFLIITLETMENFGYELHPGFTFEFIGPTLFSALVTLQDVFTLGVLCAVCYAFYRRLILRPEGLGKSKDAIIILSLTGCLMLSLFMMRAFRLVAHPDWYDHYQFISVFLRNTFLEPLALSPETAGNISSVFRWIHHFLVLGFLCYIPSSKHLHVLTAGPNTFFRHLDGPKGMRKVNLEDETVTSFGVGKITDLSWKDTLDLFACTECGRCQDACPAHNTQKPLSPKAIIADLKDVLYHNKPAIMAGKPEEIGPVIGAKVTDDVIWACTSCRACEAACPVFIEQTDKIYEIRRNLVLMESRFPAELQIVFKNVENNFSPWAMSPDDRDKWADNLQIKTMAEIVASGEQVEYLFWVGCAGSFDDRNKKVSRALVSVLRKAGIKFAILGKEEKCTGDPVRRMGN
ncbi:MAG: (Fe-S)-binding protein [Deltaproteobacteria bacterium]|nr:(Fe-S)-binding protein [Deltaproteobacteria bacterium]